MTTPFPTVATVVNKAARQLGLVATDITDPYASVDPNILQMNVLLEALGQDLARQYDWKRLQVSYTFPTVNGTASYALPADFLRLINQTEWNRTLQMPFINGLSPGQWEQLKAVTSSGTAYRMGRMFGGLLYVIPTPSAAETIAYEYQSSYWVDTAGTGVLAAATPTDKAHGLAFDQSLLIYGLKLAFRRAKGFDTTAEQGQYDSALAAALAGNGAARVLSLTPGRPALVGPDNAPETGFGS